MSSFSQEQAKWIVLEYAKLNPRLFDDYFESFFKVSPGKVPLVYEFQRIIDRFQKTDNLTLPGVTII